MGYINLQNEKDLDILTRSGVSAGKLKQALASVNRANDSYYQLSERHTYFHKILAAGDLMLKSDPSFQQLPLKDQKEWQRVRDAKTGDRGYINRYLSAVIQEGSPTVYSELIEPRLMRALKGNTSVDFDLAPEIDAIILVCGIPGYFKFLSKLADHKKGVFNAMQRSYISFLHMRALHIVSCYLMDIEQDPDAVKIALLGNLASWPEMTETVIDLCEQADPNHHDALSSHAINWLRSMYVSLFNIAMLLLRSQAEIPFELCRFLPAIPDRLTFDRSELEQSGFWDRYQDHHFLFMKLPRELVTGMGEALARLSAAERVTWMGCLGRSEIRVLILQIVSQENQFLNLADACKSIKPSNSQDHYLATRVWDVLVDIYRDELAGLETTPVSIHNLFKETRTGKRPKNKTNSGSPPTAESRTLVEADLTEIQKLSFLVVDDSDRMRQMTIKVLKDTGVNQVSEAVNGLEALKMLNGQHFDVVLCDWIMPEMTGIELVQKIMQVEAIAQSTTFIMLTTVNNKASIVEALSMGVRGYLIKPFSRKQLLEKVFFATEWLRKESLSA